MVTLACEHRRISGFCLGPPKNTGDAISKEMLRNLQFEKLMSKKKISVITCLIKKPGNQVTSLDLLTASPESRLFPPDFNL